MTTIATLVVPPPTSPTAQTVSALVQPPEEFGRQQLESDTNEQNRAKVIPFPGAQADTESFDDALASPSSVFVAQVLG